MGEFKSSSFGLTTCNSFICDFELKIGMQYISTAYSKHMPSCPITIITSKNGTYTKQIPQLTIFIHFCCSRLTLSLDKIKRVTKMSGLDFDVLTTSLSRIIYYLSKIPAVRAQILWFWRTTTSYYIPKLKIKYTNLLTVLIFRIFRSYCCSIILSILLSI